jgi:hypothetical protein
MGKIGLDGVVQFFLGVIDILRLDLISNYLSIDLIFNIFSLFLLVGYFIVYILLSTDYGIKSKKIDMSFKSNFELLIGPAIITFFTVIVAFIFSLFVVVFLGTIFAILSLFKVNNIFDNDVVFYLFFIMGILYNVGYIIKNSKKNGKILGSIFNLILEVLKFGLFVVCFYVFSFFLLSLIIILLKIISIFLSNNFELYNLLYYFLGTFGAIFAMFIIIRIYFILKNKIISSC